MSDNLPAIDRGLADDGTPVMLVGRDGRAADMAALLQLAPDLASQEHAAALALAVNHLAQTGGYRVIEDPASFEAAYRARLAHEDPAAPWQEGVMRLSDFGVPDFGSIHPPRFDGGHLRFFAQDSLLGVPYRVDVPDLTAAPSYEPMPLTPLARLGRGTVTPEFDPADLDEPAHTGP